ncbi:MAG TPA: HEPN domain-containing protein [Acetobacteraceae bacterium]|nr:HEPN domain-containing protein [Acetobacteraceae bacterium]
MKAETADYVAKARATLADAQQIAALPLPHVAAREAYLAMFHAAEAYIFEHTGKVARTHRGVRSEFARLARAEPRIGRDLVTFLGTAYQFKTRADYAVGSTATPITSAEAAAAIATTTRFIDTIAQLLPPDITPPTEPHAQP